MEVHKSHWCELRVVQQAYTLNPLPGFMGPYSQINSEFSNGLACNFPAGNLPGLEGGREPWEEHGQWARPSSQGLQNMGIVYIKWAAEPRTRHNPIHKDSRTWISFISRLRNLEQGHHPVHRDSRTWVSFISRLRNLEEGHHPVHRDSRTGISFISSGLQNLEQGHNPVHRNSRPWVSFISSRLQNLEQ
jgi:hypothetical protein